MSPDQWDLGFTSAVFIASTAVIAVVGVRLARLADRLADLTGFGEAIFGATLLGASTSLPGIMASITAASAGQADLAASNAVGGIAVQTSFLVIADLTYRRANLEHAAASVPNLVNSALLCALLALPLMAATGPDVSLFGVHPASIALLMLYGFGLHLAAGAHRRPAWSPVLTRETREDVPAERAEKGASQSLLWIAFGFAVAAVGIAGYLVGLSSIALVRITGLSETVVGTLFTSVSTSLPELVTTLAAVRQGALTLAVAGIIGGNTFDVLFLAFSDIAYREGSIYHALSDGPLFIISLTILLTAVLLLGLIRRERSGMANIGFESVLVLGVYLLGIGVIVFGHNG